MSECILWTGRVHSRGYGLMSQRRLAHRVMYETLVGSIPDGHDLHHVCEEKLCVNVKHLEPLSRRAHKRLHHDPHCGRCGELKTEPENGERRCRRCNREREAARSASNGGV